jgi:low molecular weight protein-tyrosine phosphatase
MKTVLFLCTGNYYRSRLAEFYFNHLAKEQNSDWQATSRGLRITGSNVGPLSAHTRAWLAENGIDPAEPHRMPIPVQEADFWAADHIVAVKQAEHRAMMLEMFPHWADRIEYWHVHDLDAALPDQAIPELVSLVDELFRRLTVR